MSKKFQANKLSIKDFKLVEGEIKAPYTFEVDLINSYKTDLSFNATIDKKNQLVKAEIGFCIETESSEEQEEALAKFDLVYLFEVQNLQAILKESEDVGDIKAKMNLIMAISAISFSTSRGILMTRLQGTVMKDYILPIIDPAKLHEGLADNLE